VCGNQVNAGHCQVSSAVRISCSAGAVADSSANLSLSNMTELGTPVWAIAMIALASIVLVLLVIAIVLLAIRKNREERS